MVNGGTDVGGIAGYTSDRVMLKQSGVETGNIFGKINVGGVIGSAIVQNGTSIFSELYSKNTVEITSQNNTAGGLLGFVHIFNNFQMQISNCYSRSLVKGKNTAGGFIGQLNINPSASINISFCYSSNNVLGESNVSLSIASLSIDSNSIYSQSFFYNNQTNSSLTVILSGNLNISGLNCIELSNHIANFSQSVWGGISLKSELNFNPNVTLCNNFTNSPSSSLSSSTVSSTNTPSQITTSPLETTSPFQATISSSTVTPTTTSPSTVTPTTISPSTVTSTTTSPSTVTSTTTSPSTDLPTVSVIAITVEPSQTHSPNCSAFNNCNGQGNCKINFVFFCIYNIFILYFLKLRYCSKSMCLYFRMDRTSL